MYIRSAGLADIVQLSRLRHRTLRLGLPASQINRLTPLNAALTGWLPIASRAYTFVLGERRPQAFLQVLAPARSHRWEILTLGGDSSVDAEESDEHPWHLLLNYAALTAGRRGVTRLLAKVPEAAGEIDFFRQAGFNAFSRELIFSKVYTAEDRRPVEGPLPRSQRSSDNWLVHRLYFQTEPRTVQDSEAATSNTWEVRRGQPGQPRERGWLFDEGAETIAYVRTLSDRHAHMAELLFQPTHRHQLPGLIRQVLSQLPAANGDRVYWCIRDHQAETEAILAEAGFGLAGAQALMVRFLAVKMAARERLFAPVRAPRARRLAAPEARQSVNSVVPFTWPGGLAGDG